MASNGQLYTNFVFTNVLAQIGLGYFLLVLLWFANWQIKSTFAVVILVATWGAFIALPQPGLDDNLGDPAVGVTAEWAQQHLQDQKIPPAWHKNANIAHKLDVWGLNLLPHPAGKTFVFNKGGYQTLNFLPSLATMLFGLICGELLRTGLAASWRLSLLFGMGAGLIAAGWGLDQAMICPMIKRIWTPSWAMFSAGICIWVLLALHIVFDIIPRTSWLAYPFVVVGTNSLAIYLMAQTLKPWVERTLKTHLGKGCLRASYNWRARRYGSHLAVMLSSYRCGPQRFERS